MEEYIFICVMFVIFFFRDVQLLTTGGELSLNNRLLTYGLIELLSATSFLVAFPHSENVRFVDLLRVVWPIGIALHLIAGLTCFLACGRASKPIWAIALLPNPILVLSLVSAAHMIQSHKSWAEACLLTTLLWVVLVSMGVSVLNRQLKDSAESAFIVEFAGFSNLAMLAAISVGLIAN